GVGDQAQDWEGPGTQSADDHANDRRRGDRMRRRAFISLLGGAAAWPLAASAERQARIPKIGILWHAANAQEEGPLFTGLVEGFSKLGYVDGRNISLEHRFP